MQRFAKLHPIHLVGAALVLIALVAGVQLARSNSDLICYDIAEETGPCSNGSWTPWSTTSESVNQTACTRTVNEQRVYSGTRDTVSKNLVFDTGLDSHSAQCGQPELDQAKGDITVRSASCQIVETRTRTLQGTGTGASCTVSGGGGGGGGGTGGNGNGVIQSTITSQSSSETAGQNLGQTIIYGGANEYQQQINISHATLNISVVPTIVRSGTSVKVSWTSDHMQSCIVTATNHDTWTKLASGGETTTPIISKTIYTLTCTPAPGRTLTDTAEVDIIPDFQEQ